MVEGIFIDGNEKFRALMEDLRNAEHFIHIQYYIIKNDVLFNQIKDILIEKAAQGVEVRVLFDAMGCRSVRHSYWKWLNEKGVQTAEFFPAILRRLQLRINYRNHRKIVVVDNKVAYVGGFNVGKEYIDLDEKFGHWRDTHLRIWGSGVLGLRGAIYFRLELCGRNCFAPELFRESKPVRGFLCFWIIGSVRFRRLVSMLRAGYIFGMYMGCHCLNHPSVFGAETLYFRYSRKLVKCRYSYVCHILVIKKHMLTRH